MIAPTQLESTVDFQAIREVRDLPVSWMSAHHVDIEPAAAYERECKAKGIASDPAEIVRLLNGPIAHLRRTILENGLRFVGMHLADGTQLFDDTEYAGLVSCGCGAVHDSSSVIDAQALEGADLGDGYKLGLVTHGKNPLSTTSCVEKEFTTGNKKTKVGYYITPPSSNASGDLAFRYETRVQEVLDYDLVFADGSVQRDSGEIHREFQKVTIVMPKTGDGNNESTSLHFNRYLLPTPRLFRYSEFGFTFDFNGVLQAVTSLAHDFQNYPHTAFPGEDIYDAYHKSASLHASGTPEARAISLDVFGRDVNALRHDARGSLNALVDAATRELDIDVSRTLVFQ